MRLENKVALVTGGGTGIGAAVAQRFSREGADVVVLGPDAEPLESVAAAIGGIACVGDASEATNVRAAIDSATERFGGLDVLVANAGAEARVALGESDEATWEAGIRTNLTTAVVSAREALPALARRGGGSIVIVSSVAAVSASSRHAPYIVAKTALLGLARSLAVDYGPEGIRVNVVCPGAVRTRMLGGRIDQWAASRGISSEEAWARVNSVAPLRRAAEPEEIASVCLFLASDESSVVTGATLVADCGQSAVNVGMLPLRDD